MIVKSFSPYTLMKLCLCVFQALKSEGHRLTMNVEEKSRECSTLMQRNKDLIAERQGLKESAAKLTAEIVSFDPIGISKIFRKCAYDDL